MTLAGAYLPPQGEAAGRFMSDHAVEPIRDGVPVLQSRPYILNSRGGAAVDVDGRAGDERSPGGSEEHDHVARFLGGRDPPERNLPAAVLVELLQRIGRVARVLLPASGGRSGGS